MPPKQKVPSHVGMMSIECMEDSRRWWGDQAMTEGFPALMHHTLALAGEVGELANLIKKVDRGSLDIRQAIVRKDMAFELADVFIYVLNLAAVMGVDLEELYRLKRAENEQRFMVQRRLRDARNNANLNGGGEVNG